MTDYDIIREACIKANPEIVIKATNHVQEIRRERPIRLADVLLAVRELNEAAYFKRIHIGPGGGSPVSGTEKICDDWDFRNDDLSQQSPETLKFLAYLVSV
jgi:hypothetical protein